MSDMPYFPKLLELRERHLSPPHPADTIRAVSAPGRPGLEIAIAALALVDGRIEG